MEKQSALRSGRPHSRSVCNHENPCFRRKSNRGPVYVTKMNKGLDCDTRKMTLPQQGVKWRGFVLATIRVRTPLPELVQHQFICALLPKLFRSCGIPRRSDPNSGHVGPAVVNKVALDGISPTTSESPANSHSTNCSTFVDQQSIRRSTASVRSMSLNNQLKIAFLGPHYAKCCRVRS
jgi:hypothetical protein